MKKIKTATARLDDWITFLAGHWTKKMPRKSGMYPVALARIQNNTEYTKEIDISKTITIEVVGGKPFPSRTWLGWWWSKPFPTLPPIPEGEKK